MNKIFKIAINGASGNMGKAICKLADHRRLAYAIQHKLTSSSSTEEIRHACNNSDILLDFSSPDGSLAIMKILMEYQDCKLLVGTTALKEKHFEYMHKLSDSRAVLYAPNTSITANILAELSAKASSILHDFDVEIVESHHRAKKDAPSGTALMIGQKIANARNINFQQNAIYTRYQSGARKQGQIGLLSVRGGGIYGDNKVILAGDNELLTIEARALSRDVFAQGALRAAVWLAKQEPGLYSMKDFLNLS
ncbi:MAG: 4-hydroxy-tetrahydrodipicolinate reductase [Rickettsiaceae bacterium]|nr:4-hydroxy-tetrahydrodipicolinate reductase [Rickettsiaceae bacterium]